MDYSQFTSTHFMDSTYMESLQDQHDKWSPVVRLSNVFQL